MASRQDRIDPIGVAILVAIALALIGFFLVPFITEKANAPKELERWESTARRIEAVGAPLDVLYAGVWSKEAGNQAIVVISVEGQPSKEQVLAVVEAEYQGIKRDAVRSEIELMDPVAITYVGPEDGRYRVYSDVRCSLEAIKNTQPGETKIGCIPIQLPPAALYITDEFIIWPGVPNP